MKISFTGLILPPNPRVYQRFSVCDYFNLQYQRFSIELRKIELCTLPLSNKTSSLKRNHLHGLILKNFMVKTRMVADLKRNKKADIKGNGGPPKCERILC